MAGLYRTITELTDFGPYIHKVLLPLPKKVQAKELEEDSFIVYVERKNFVNGELIQDRIRWESEETVESKGYCEVVSTYVSDAEGNSAEEGNWIVLELTTRPFYRLSSQLAMEKGFNTFVFLDFCITQQKSIPTASGELTGLVYDRLLRNEHPQMHRWIHGKARKSIRKEGNQDSEGLQYSDVLQYALFSPKMGEGSHPLIIWLHGAGEGGSDPSIAYLGNQVINLAKDSVQEYFGGAYILVPQSPTVWMDDGRGEISLSGKSIYTNSLKKLIDEILQIHGEIDSKRIYIGGCSNGGFMTMRMILDYPDFFAAAFPVCEALLDERISDHELESILQVPIWFTHAKNDGLVDAERFSIPTYNRLKNLGHNNIHFSYFDTVIDSRGYRYDHFAHASWICMLNDDCRMDFDGKAVLWDGEEVSLLQWLAKQ